MNKDMLGKYNLVLGLEIHVQPKTERKMFCRCAADIFESEPNTHTCPTCLGLPGALPVPNQDAVRKTQLLGLIFGCDLNSESRFDRKHYFYPDLPKGYQISQYKQPLCEGGAVTLASGKVASLERIHLEEDTAKSTHEGDKTLINFNMSSMPLIEIVTKPTFDSVEEAVEFSKHVQKTVREFGLGDADMEKGQMRLEPNISLRTDEMKDNDELPPYKVEIKNINSFRFMEKAVKAEIIRQKEVLDAGDTPLQENRGYDESTGTTVGQRGKEDAHDYRYFPEPDIPPMVFDKAYLNDLEEEFEKLKKGTDSYMKASLLQALDVKTDLKERAVDILSTSDLEKAVEVAREIDAKKVLNVLLNKKDLRDMSAKELLEHFATKEDRVSDVGELEKIVKQVLEENQDAVQNYKSGKESALQFLIGMIMKQSQGKADISVAKEILLKEI